MSSEARQQKVESLVERLLFSKPLTPGRAGALIAGTTLTLTLIGGLSAWILDRDGFASLGASLWWSMQTVTTVGYGDVVPENTIGRVIGAVLMLNGIALISVVTASVTAVLIEQARRRRSRADNADMEATLARIEARLSRIEASLGDSDQRAP